MSFSWREVAEFHGDAVAPTYHCFGCGVHGNAVGFLMEQHGMGFVEAVRDLAQQAGLVVPEEEGSPGAREEAVRHKQRQLTLTDVLARAADGYRQQLKGSDRAIAYLKGRGLSGEVAARFGLGYAADSWRGLASIFPSYDDPLLEESGLVISRSDDAAADGVEDAATTRRYDRFRDRIMFPIRSVQGAVIGFGGRIIDRGEPKYLNSPETPVFSKGQELYGLFEARTAIRQRGYALVVEGYMDVVALAQAGFGNAVATLGTACTAEHVHKLARFSEAVVFSFDGDAAGRRAAGRALEASLPHATDTRSFRFLFLPPEHDPDTFVRERGAAAFEQAVAEAVPLSRQLLSLAAEGADLATAEGRARLLANARPLWTALPEGMLKRQLLGEIASRAALPVDELADAWKASGATGAKRSAPVLPTARSRRPARQVMRQPADRIAWMLLESGWWDGLAAAITPSSASSRAGTASCSVSSIARPPSTSPPAWAVLRERLAAEPWSQAALAMVDAEDPAIEPVADDLPLSLDQLRTSAGRHDAMRVLGRI